MPGITIKGELTLFKTKLKKFVDKIERNFLRIEMKNTFWGVRDLINLHIPYVEEMIEELEETENISAQQRERAETLLWSAQKLIHLENLLKRIEEGSSNNYVPNT